MATRDYETARDIWRDEILAAMDRAARKIYGDAITRNDCGATDADLPDLFPALDAQLLRLSPRFGYLVSADGTIVSEAE